MNDEDTQKRDQFGRIVFDLEKNEKLAKSRLQAEKESKKSQKIQIDPSSLKPLNVSLENLKLSKGINRRKIIGENIPTDKIGHWSCPVCQLYFKDSNVYLKHLTSPEHNEKLGMSLEIQPTTDEEVIKRVQQWEDFYIKGIPVPPIYKSGDAETGIQTKFPTDITHKQKTTEKEKTKQKDATEYEYEYEYEEDN